MPVYTQTQVDALRAAIARGVREVEYDNQRVRYGSLQEMQTQLNVMERDISGQTVKRTVFGASRGLR